MQQALVHQHPLLPLPPAPTLDPRHVALGESLFHDRLLSRDQTVSCASCHDLQRGGTDRLARSRGVDGLEGPTNAPTVFNVALDFVFMRDGSAASLEAQMAGPLYARHEMGSDWETVLERLSRHEEYARLFAAAYPDGLTEANVASAIATFQRSLLTPDAPFDRYLQGDAAALDARALAGYQLFKTRGCTSCHQGANIGGNMFQRFGVMDDYFADRGAITDASLGRFNVTGREQDRHVFKVPSLRNVAVTAPYFHDGSVASLEQAIAIMARYQLGLALPDEEIEAIAAFLNSLTGTFRGSPLQ